MKRIIVQFFIVAAFMVGCDSGKSNAAKVAATLTEADNGKTVSANFGEVVVVELNGNVTTGYSWTTNAFNAAVLKLQGDPEYVSPTQAPTRVGAGGKFIFRFGAIAAGTSTVHLVYRRPWETGIAPAQEFKASVVVK